MRNRKASFPYLMRERPLAPLMGIYWVSTRFIAYWLVLLVWLGYLEGGSSKDEGGTSSAAASL